MLAHKYCNNMLENFSIFKHENLFGLNINDMVNHFITLKPPDSCPHFEKQSLIHLLFLPRSHLIDPRI